MDEQELTPEDHIELYEQEMHSARNAQDLMVIMRWRILEELRREFGL